MFVRIKQVEMYLVWFHDIVNMFIKLVLLGFRSLVEVESTYWVVVNLLNMQNEQMDVHQSDISKLSFFYAH